MKALIEHVQSSTGYVHVRTVITGAEGASAKVTHFFSPTVIKPNKSYFAAVKRAAGKMQRQKLFDSIKFSPQQTSDGSFLTATHSVPWSKLNAVSSK